jgi:hypothetical protein
MCDWADEPRHYFVGSVPNWKAHAPPASNIKLKSEKKTWAFALMQW